MIRHRANTGPRQAGFTLLEVLVAVTVFAVMATALYSSFRLGVGSWQAGVREGATSEEIRVVERFLGRYLGSAVPVVVNDGDGWRNHFEGAPEAMRFVTEMPAHLGYGGLYEVRVGMPGDGDSDRLVVERRLFHPELAGEPGPGALDRSILAEGLDEVSIDYYGRDGEDEPASWHRTWARPVRLPELVRLRVRTGDGRAWPVMVIPLHVQAPRSMSSDDAARPRRTLDTDDDGGGTGSLHERLLEGLR